jgi:hypothetical protein
VFNADKRTVGVLAPQGGDEPEGGDAHGSHHGAHDGSDGGFHPGAGVR